MRSFCAMFPTTPTTVIHSVGLPDQQRRRFPIALSQGHALLANRSLTRTTGAADAPSNIVNSRPARTGALRVAKYEGPATSVDTVGRCWSSTVALDARASGTS